MALIKYSAPAPDAPSQGQQDLRRLAGAGIELYLNGVLQSEKDLSLDNSQKTLGDAFPYVDVLFQNDCFGQTIKTPEEELYNRCAFGSNVPKFPGQKHSINVNTIEGEQAATIVVRSKGPAYTLEHKINVSEAGGSGYKVAPTWLIRGNAPDAVKQIVSDLQKHDSKGHGWNPHKLPNERAPEMTSTIAILGGRNFNWGQWRKMSPAQQKLLIPAVQHGFGDEAVQIHMTQPLRFDDRLNNARLAMISTMPEIMEKPNQDFVKAIVQTCSVSGQDSRQLNPQWFHEAMTNLFSDICDVQELVNDFITSFDSLNPESCFQGLLELHQSIDQAPILKKEYNAANGKTEQTGVVTPDQKRACKDLIYNKVVAMMNPSPYAHCIE